MDSSSPKRRRRKDTCYFEPDLLIRFPDSGANNGALKRHSDNSFSGGDSLAVYIYIYTTESEERR